MEVREIPASAESRMSHMCRQHKSIKGLKFGDCQDSINATISARVIDAPMPKKTHSTPNHHTPHATMQNGIILEEEEPNEEPDINDVCPDKETYSNDTSDEADEEVEGDPNDASSSEFNDGSTTEASVESRADVAMVE